MKKILTIWIFLLATGFAKAQYYPTYSQYLLNGQAINPAYAGSREVLSAVALYRDQWIGFDGAPKTMTLSAHSPLRSLNSAAGIQIFSDKIGVSNHSGLFFNYAYRLRFKKNNRTLAFGIGSGLDIYRANLNNVSVINAGDPAFENQLYKSTRLNFSTGIYYYSKRFFVGWSVPEMLHYGYDVYTNAPDTMKTKPTNNFFIIGYTFKLNNDIKFAPSILRKGYPNHDAQMDYNFSLIVYDALSMGFSVRSNESLVWLIEYQVIQNQLRIGYAHDFVTSRLSRYTHGTNEFLIRYELNYKSNVTSTKFF